MPSTGIGGLIGLGLGAYGSKPNIPNWNQFAVDPTAIQQQTIQGNVANFGDIAKMATGVNQFNQQQLNALIDQQLPGARQQIQQNVGSQLRGELPTDVQNAIIRGNAARSVAGGYAGTGMSANLTARDLGLTSLNLINQGLSSAESWLQRAQAPLMDATSMFFSPQQRLAQANFNSQMGYQNALMRAQVAAAPDPAMAALAQGIDSDFARVENAALSVAGMGFGGGMGSMGSSSSMTGLGGYGSNFSAGGYTPPAIPGTLGYR